MFQTIRRSFRVAAVTGALTALSVTFLTALAENDTVRDGRDGANRARPAATAEPAWPRSGTVRVIDLRRAPVGAVVVQPSRASAHAGGAA